MIDPVVVAALIAACPWGISRGLGESHLPLVAHLRGFRVAQDFRAPECAGPRAHGSRAGYVVHLFTRGGRDVYGQFGPSGHRLRCLRAPSAHDGARLGVVETVVVSGLGSAAQVPVVYAGRGHGVAVRGAGGST